MFQEHNSIETTEALQVFAVFAQSFGYLLLCLASGWCSLRGIEFQLFPFLLSSYVRIVVSEILSQTAAQLLASTHFQFTNVRPIICATGSGSRLGPHCSSPDPVSAQMAQPISFLSLVVQSLSSLHSLHSLYSFLANPSLRNKIGNY